MKHYILFINGKCFVEFREADKITRKSIGIKITDKSRQELFRRRLNKLLNTNSNINANNITTYVQQMLLDKFLE